jgi:hypothetical protein
LRKEQKWNIEEKFLASNNYQGKFVNELTADGLYSDSFILFEP